MHADAHARVEQTGVGILEHHLHRRGGSGMAASNRGHGRRVTHAAAVGSCGSPSRPRAVVDLPQPIRPPGPGSRLASTEGHAVDRAHLAGHAPQGRAHRKCFCRPDARPSPASPGSPRPAGATVLLGCQAPTTTGPAASLPVGIRSGASALGARRTGSRGGRGWANGRPGAGNRPQRRCRDPSMGWQARLGPRGREPSRRACVRMGRRARTARRRQPPRPCGRRTSPPRGGRSRRSRPGRA